MTRDHLHRDDCPRALAILHEACDARWGGAPPGGYEPTEVGAYVDWDALATSWLSSTERAAVLVARGVAAHERHGGDWGRLQHVVEAAFEEQAR